MEPAGKREICEPWLAAMDSEPMSMEFYRTMCKTHPAYREADAERRADMRLKREELGDQFEIWFFDTHIGIDEFVKASRTNQPVREYPHAFTR